MVQLETSLDLGSFASYPGPIVLGDLSVRQVASPFCLTGIRDVSVGGPVALPSISPESTTL